MKTALVHDWLNGMRGGEKVLEHICSLFPDAPLFTLHGEKEKLSPLLRQKDILYSMIQNLPLRKKYYRYYLPFFPLAVERFRFDGFELVISTSHCAAKGIKPADASCHVCYCFTPMRYVWELSGDYFGENALKHFLLNPFLSYLKSWDKKSSGRVFRFLTISRTTQERIKRFYGRDSLVIYPPCNYPFDPDKEKKDFYLILSALVPYKKIDLAIRVFNETKLPLVIAGSGPDEDRLKKASGPNVAFTGWIDEDKKEELLRSAKALIFPGVEDFGLTPLEAIAFGTPVVAYKKGGILETITEETGVFFEEQNEPSLKGVLLSFERKPFVIEKKPDHFDRFSPEHFKKEFKSAIDETFDAFRKGKKFY
ncbi:MAG: glycosyltransferase [Candidatus Aureabacteria bacterium]|nr:glycosyltransferase [Candidatus Auribacterota bacterium]